MTTVGADIPADQSLTTSLEDTEQPTIFNKLTKNKLHCTVCDKIVSSKSSANHARMHSVSQPYSCPICNKTFAHRSSVNRHKKSHDKGQMYRCSICDKGFASKCTFEIHLELHKNSGSCFPCNVCEKVFSTTSQLREHMAHHAQIQYLQIAEAASKGDLRLVPHFNLVADDSKNSDLLTSTNSFDASRESTDAVVHGDKVPSEAQETYQKSESDGLIYHDTQSFQLQNCKEIIDLHHNLNSKLYVLTSSSSHETVQDGNDLHIRVARPVVTDNEADLHHENFVSNETQPHLENYTSNESQPHPENYTSNESQPHPENYASNETHTRHETYATNESNPSHENYAPHETEPRHENYQPNDTETHLQNYTSQESPPDQNHRDVRLTENQKEMTVVDECILRKMLASKIVGSVNAMSAKRALSSTVGRSSLDAETVRKYSEDLLSVDAYSKFADRVDTSIKVPTEEEGEESRSLHQADPRAEISPPPQEVVPVTMESYSAVTDDPKYPTDVDLRNKIPQIRYFVNIRKQNILYAPKPQDVSINSKDYPNDIQNTHILQNAQILQNAHILQNVQDLQHATILQNAQFLQNAHILQNAHALVCVDAPVMERRDSTETGEGNDGHILSVERGNNVDKLESGQTYRYVETTAPEESKTPEPPTTRGAVLYAETAPMTVCRGEPPDTVPIDKPDPSTADSQEDAEPHQRRELLNYSQLPPKTSSVDALESEDPYTFTLPVTSRDSSAVGDNGNADVNSPDGAANDAGALAVHAAPTSKRPRKSGSSSSKRSRSESGYKSFKCTSCDRYFPCSSALERHRQSKHPPHVVCHTCAICGKALYHPSHIYIHMRTHV